MYVAIAGLHTLCVLLQADLTGSSCQTFSYAEYLQIYDSMDIHHLPSPVSKYCVLKSLDHNIRSLLIFNQQERGLTTDTFPPCTLGLCSD